MGQAERHIVEILGSSHRPGEFDSLDKIVPKAIEDPRVRTSILQVYRSLDGVLPDIPIPSAKSKWDIMTKFFVVEVDEDAHFNRYRSITLDSPFYSQIAHFPLAFYREFCSSKESLCRGHGNFWENPSAKRQFGISDPPKVFGANGASRWKQRAFYDFLKDIVGLTIGFPVIRISVWDSLRLSSGTLLVGDALKHRNNIIDCAIRNLIDDRASKFLESPPFDRAEKPTAGLP